MNDDGIGPQPYRDDVDNPNWTHDNAPFAWWYTECARQAIIDYVCPDEYVWDLYNPGRFRGMYDYGLTPREAVIAVFRSM